MKKLIFLPLLLVGCTLNFQQPGAKPELSCQDKPAQERRAWNVAQALAKIATNPTAVSQFNTEVAAVGCKELAIALPKAPKPKATPKPTPKPKKEKKKDAKTKSKKAN